MVVVNLLLPESLEDSSQSVQVLDEWISTIFVQSWGLKAKPDEVIFGAETRT